MFPMFSFIKISMNSIMIMFDDYDLDDADNDDDAADDDVDDAHRYQKQFCQRD